MNRLTICILCIVLLFSLFPTAGIAAPITVVDPSDKAVLYFVPHADDETLSFSVPLLNDMRAGKKVYLILMSPGEDSIAREVVNGQYDEETGSSTNPPGKPLYCKWHQKYHDPVAERHKDGYLTKEKFGQARIQEFYKVGEEFSIPRSQLKVNLLPNGQFSYQSVKSIILMNAKLFPNAQFKSFSAVDEMIDHAMVGKVLNDLYREKRIKKPQTNIVSIATDRHDHNSTGTQPKDKETPGYKLYLTNSADRNKILNAINRVYKAWDPQNGSYGLGYHSVPTQFDAMASETYTKISRY